MICLRSLKSLTMEGGECKGSGGSLPAGPDDTKNQLSLIWPGCSMENNHNCSRNQGCTPRPAPPRPRQNWLPRPAPTPKIFNTAPPCHKKVTAAAPRKYCEMFQRSFGGYFATSQMIWESTTFEQYFNPFGNMVCTLLWKTYLIFFKIFKND